MQFQQALQRLSTQLLKPLLPAVADYEHWVISPDGAPWLVPWSSRCWCRAGKEMPAPYVVEKHRVSFVVSGRDLIEKPQPVSGNPSLIMAAADFDHAPQDAVASRRPAELARTLGGSARARGASGRVDLALDPAGRHGGRSRSSLPRLCPTDWRIPNTSHKCFSA